MICVKADHFFKRSEKSENQIITILICLMTALAACVPLENGTLPYSRSMAVHLNTIEALAECITSGHPFPAVFPDMNSGYGYGSPLFSCMLFWYIPSILCALGMSAVFAMRIFFFLVFFFQALSMQRCCRIAAQRQGLSAWAAGAWYVFANTCWYSMYHDGALEEAIARIFIPLALSSVFQLCTAQKCNKTSCIAGFTGLLLTSREDALCMALFLCIALFCFRKQCKKKAWKKDLLVSAAWILALSAFYTIPLLEQLSAGKWSMGINTALQEALKPSELLALIPLTPSHPGASIGLMLTLLPLLLFYHAPDRSKFCRMTAVIGYLALLCSTTLFPWRLLNNTWFHPSALVSMADACLSLCAGWLLARYPMPKKDRPYIRFVITGISAVLILLQINLQDIDIGPFTASDTAETLKDASRYEPDDQSMWNITEAGDGRYLPAVLQIDADQSSVVSYEGQMLAAERQENGDVVAAYQGSGTYQFPKIWYKGYVVYADHQIYQTYPDPAAGLAEVTIPASDSETLVLHYERTALQTAGILISMSAGIAAILLKALRKAGILNAQQDL